MKWTALTKSSGDDGSTSFANKRVPKDYGAIKVLGEIDMLNATIGMMALTPPGPWLQDVNRQIMGYIHTQGKTGNLENILIQLTDALQNYCERLDDLDPDGPKGWANYTNAWFVACCQCRRVEALLVEISKESHATYWDAEGKIRNCSPVYADVFPKGHEKMLAIYNRMSKVLYCLGVIEE